jgi:hypothetical protein
VAESNVNAARHGHQDRSDSVASLPFRVKMSVIHMVDYLQDHEQLKALSAFKTHTGGMAMKLKKLGLSVGKCR